MSGRTVLCYATSGRGAAFSLWCGPLSDGRCRPYDRQRPFRRRSDGSRGKAARPGADVHPAAPEPADRMEAGKAARSGADVDSVAPEPADRMEAEVLDAGPAADAIQADVGKRGAVGSAKTGEELGGVGSAQRPQAVTGQVVGRGAVVMIRKSRNVYRAGQACIAGLDVGRMDRPPREVRRSVVRKGGTGQIAGRIPHAVAAAKLARLQLNGSGQAKRRAARDVRATRMPDADAMGAARSDAASAPAVPTIGATPAVVSTPARSPHRYQPGPFQPSPYQQYSSPLSVKY